MQRLNKLNYQASFALYRKSAFREVGYRERLGQGQGVLLVGPATIVNGVKIISKFRNDLKPFIFI